MDAFMTELRTQYILDILNSTEEELEMEEKLYSQLEEVENNDGANS